MRRQTAARQCKDACWNQLDPINGAALQQNSALCKSALTQLILIGGKLSGDLATKTIAHNTQLPTQHYIPEIACVPIVSSV